MTTIEKILQATATHFGCSVDNLLGRSRQYPLVEHRQIAMYLCRELTDASFPAIGKSFDRDHTTVLYADRKIRDSTWRHDLYVSIHAITSQLHEHANAV